MKDLILAFFFFVIAKNIRIMSIFCFHTGEKDFLYRSFCRFKIIFYICNVLFRSGLPSETADEKGIG